MFWDNDRTKSSVVRWYFVPDDRPFLPVPNRFVSETWDETHWYCEGAGESPFDKTSYSNGAPPALPPKLTPCGELSWFTNGAPSDAPGLALNSLGLVMCCFGGTPALFSCSCSKQAPAFVALEVSCSCNKSFATPLAAVSCACSQTRALIAPVLPSCSCVVESGAIVVLASCSCEVANGYPLGTPCPHISGHTPLRVGFNGTGFTGNYAALNTIKIFAQDLFVPCDYDSGFFPLPPTGDPCSLNWFWDSASGHWLVHFFDNHDGSGTDRYFDSHLASWDGSSDVLVLMPLPGDPTAQCIISPA